MSRTLASHTERAGRMFRQGRHLHGRMKMRKPGLIGILGIVYGPDLGARGQPLPL